MVYSGMWCNVTQQRVPLDFTIRMVPTLSQWNSVQLVGMLGNGVESCGMEWNGM